jgi:hypothetical protein
MICFASPWTDRGLIYNAQGRICNSMLYVGYICLTKAKPIHKRQTHPFMREELHKDYDHKGTVKKLLVVGLKGLGAKTN